MTGKEQKMTKVKHVPAGRRRRKKFIKKAKGQFGARSRRYRQARESVQKGMMYATRDRKQKKRNFRNLWIARINAACRARGISYSSFMSKLKKAKINLNRKVLAELAISDKTAFDKLVDLTKGK